MQSYPVPPVGEIPVKAVMLQVPPALLAERRRTGADRWDEVWAGVLHMVPGPELGHQDLAVSFLLWLRSWWVPATGGKAWLQVNVAPASAGSDWTRNFRIPDLVLLTPARFARIRETHLAGGPDAVVEIRSPGDETYEKLPFYAEIGVRELWVIDRDTRAVEIHTLETVPPRCHAADAEGWIRSALGVAMRADPGARLAIHLTDDPGSLARIP